MTESTIFTIMTYNVYCRESKLFKDSQDERCKLIPKAINKYSDNIDCIIVQEIFDKSAEKILDKEMEKYGFKHKSKKVGKNVFKNFYFFKHKIIEDGGIKIYSKLPIEYQKNMIFKSGVGEDAIAGKGVSYIRVNKGGIDIHIFGTHLQAGKTEEKVESKFSQIEQFRDFMDDQKMKENDLVVLGGDFNLDKLSQYDLLMQAQQLFDKKLVELDMNTFIPERNDLQKRDNPEKNKKQNLLDHFFSNSDDCKSIYIQLKSEKSYKIRKPKKCRKLPGFLKKLSKYSKKKIKLNGLSDHEPVVAFFTLS